MQVRSVVVAPPGVGRTGAQGAGAAPAAGVVAAAGRHPGQVAGAGRGVGGREATAGVGISAVELAGMAD